MKKSFKSFICALVLLCSLGFSFACESSMGGYDVSIKTPDEKPLTPIALQPVPVIYPLQTLHVVSLPVLTGKVVEMYESDPLYYVGVVEINLPSGEKYLITGTSKHEDASMSEYVKVHRTQVTNKVTGEVTIHVTLEEVEPNLWPYP